MTTPRTDARSRHKRKPKHCEECGAAGRLWRFRGQWVCDECMIGEEEPPRLEDHMRGFGALGNDGRLPGDCALDYGEKGSLLKALNKAMEKRGMNSQKRSFGTIILGDMKK